MIPDYHKNLEAEATTFPGRTIQETALVLGYETGMVLQRTIFALSTRNEQEKRAYYADLMAELSDVMTQSALMFEKVRPMLSPALQELYCDIATLMELGAERQIERMQEWRGRAGTDDH